MDNCLISARNVTFGYDPEKPVVFDLSLDIHRGDFLAVLGANGAGKTTSVKLLNGLLKPQKGTITIKGRDSADMTTKQISEVVGYCYQNPDHQIFCETVREEVEFGLKNRNVPPEEMDQRVDEALALVGLLNFKDEAPYQLGKGERQKLAVASILALRPELLIVDEPTTGLDWKDSMKIFDLLESLVGTGMTCLVITHNLYITEKYIQRTILFSGGRIIADGPTKDVLACNAELKEASVGMLRVTQLADRLFRKYGVQLPHCTNVDAFIAALLAERRESDGRRGQSL